MRRRDFVAGVVMASAMRPAAAQQPAKTKRIAWVVPATKVADLRAEVAPFFRAFFEELNRLGYVEGRNLVIERYSGEGQPARYVEIARDAAGSRPDLIFTTTGKLAVIFKSITTEIPIVTLTVDPVTIGLVPSLARPGGNITGVTADGGFGLYEKRIQLLKELVPNLSSAFYLVSQEHWEKSRAGAAFREAARHAGISLIPILLGTFNEAAYESAFQSMEQQQQQAEAFLASYESEHITHAAALVRLVAKTRLPAMFSSRDLVHAGGLMAYSIDFKDLFRHAARQIASILKGTKPQDIPFYQPTKFELVINMKTAKSLGIDVPPTLLARADEVIE